MSKECTTHHHACDCREEKFKQLEQENAALREAKDAYFKHNNILVELMTEDQKQKALEILMSRPKEAQP
jgi:hypothetical protein